MPVVSAPVAAEVRLPAQASSDCAGQVPILVASDEAAQSDIYSAVTLAGVLGTECIVLAGARDEPMPDDQQARLDAAAAGGWVVGGTGAVPAAKIEGRGMKRLAGTDRWHTARLVGGIAADIDGDITQLTAQSAASAISGPQPILGSIVVGRGYVCALRTDQTIACSAPSIVQADLGKFTYISGSNCGIRDTQELACWWRTNEGLAEYLKTPPGEFTMVSLGGPDYGQFACGLRVDQTMACWTGYGEEDDFHDRFGKHDLDAPSGAFLYLTVEYEIACGVRSDYSLECWRGGGGFSENNRDGRFAQLGYDFAAVEAYPGSVCAIRLDRSVACWNAHSRGDTLDPVEAPSGSFTTISAGWGHMCGIRTDGRVVCWGGSNNSGQNDAPAGVFVAVAAADVVSCGIRVDRSIECWGYVSDLLKDIPSGVFGGSPAPPKLSDIAGPGVRVPPEVLYGECNADTVPVVVASDVGAQSDIYSAVTLAGVLGDACLVLAGPRGEPMHASQKERLAAAADGGFVVGGTSAVPDSKLAGRQMTRIGGADRWATAVLIGDQAQQVATE